ncbi:MAG: threonine aldolase family protein, partial [Flavobacteriales bacterium]
MIDLRSDTVTKPTPAMRAHMASAPVGDDVFNEDPSVLELEYYAARLFNKEAAIFCASGTQTNQIAIMAHTTPGGEVICHEESHIYKYEGGGIARNSQCSMKLLRGNYGKINASDLPNALNNPLDIHLPLSQLVSIEDTANRGGGSVYDYQEILRIAAFCKTNNLPFHLDGARLFNALAVNKMDPGTYAQVFDSISICLSKSLGAPIGSLLIGSKDFIRKARRIRKVLGGGMRQAGIIAAGGMYALTHHVERLGTDHMHAKRLANCLTELAWVDSIFPVETNIVVVVLKAPSRRDEIIQTLKDQGILCIAFGPG